MAEWRRPSWLDWRPRPISDAAAREGPLPQAAEPPPVLQWRRQVRQIGPFLEWEVALMLPSGADFTLSRGNASCYHEAEIGMDAAQARIEQIYRASKFIGPASPERNKRHADRPKGPKGTADGRRSA